MLVLTLTASTGAAEEIEFQHTIRPILAEHCYECHGPDEAVREAGLRLDQRDSAVARLDSDHAAIVPGDPGESELLARVIADDPDLRMPPPDAGAGLTAVQIAALRQWIEQGAQYSQHWAFTPPNATLPSSGHGNGANPIDRIVGRRLSERNLELSRPAAPEILCRRLYLDLIGIPPSPSEVVSFVEAAEDDLSGAASQTIEALLASPHFGEKWARHWLDVGRYADSNGFEKDLPRQQWAWRDWVINAVNADMPYDQFLVEQLAGDLLPNRTQSQIVATGFLRNGMLNEEGAIVPEQFRIEGIVDRIDCIGKAVLGLTLQCAQCHSHKFDPITQDEYYGLFAFLNNADDAQHWVYTEPQLTTIAELRASVTELKRQMQQDRPNWEVEMREWEQTQNRRNPNWEHLAPTETPWDGGLNHPEVLPDRSIIVLGHPTNAGEMSVRAEPDLAGATGLRFEALTYGDAPFNGPGRSRVGSFAISELSVEIKKPGSSEWVDVSLQQATADFSNESRLLSSLPGAKLADDDKRTLGPVEYLIDGDAATAWHSDRGPGRRNAPSVAVVQFAEPLDAPPGTQMHVRLAMRHAPSGDKAGMMIIARFRLGVTKSTNPTAPPYDHRATLALATPPGDRSDEERAALFEAWSQGVDDFDHYRQRLAELWQRFPDDAPTSVMSLQQRPAALHRTTRLLNRGEWNDGQQAVAPHVPAMLHPLPDTDEPARLRFARWAASDKSPLTARVEVNRVWQAMFGRGLVETSEDFGTRAPRPEYLDLLDQLAVDFMQHNWSVKQLIRTIAGSKVYQQTSLASDQLREIDPQNRWLARGPRFRTDAEVVRDIALAASGLLHREVGGPSVFPPVPESVLQFNFVVPDYWHPAPAPQRYRRSLYTFCKRTMPDPVLAAFDAPNADTACARRVRSNSPLAALVSLNEPVFMEAARALAVRILREGGATDQERADYAFRLCTGRGATPAERTEVVALLQTQRSRLAAGWLSINEVATGDPAVRPKTPADATPQDAAAWTIAARVILNLDETMSKN